MPSRITIIVAFAAVVAAQAEACQGASCDREDIDSVTLLQTHGAAQSVTKGERAAAFEDQTGGSTTSTKAALAEYVAMTLFVLIGCGSAMGVAKEPGWVLQVSLTFGFAISALAYSIGHYSGGHINCAVTLGLVLTGHCTMAQGLLNFVAQLLGAITGALILKFMYPEDEDKSGGIGSNSIPEGRVLNALIGEVMMTFLLVFVVLETATNPATAANREMACLAIGLAVFLAHSVLIPIDGCSINPTRSLGPALVRKFLYKSSGSLQDMWVFWAGPLLGAAGAAFVSTSLMAK